MNEQLLDEMRDALAIAHSFELSGNHPAAHEYGQIAARKIEQALAEGYGDNDQLKVRGELVKMPSEHVAPTQIDWR